MKLLTLKTTMVFVATALGAVMVYATVKWVIRYHQRTMADTCINYLRAIDSGKQQWALETHKGTNAMPTWDDLNPYIINVLIDQPGSNRKMLICPAGGTYTIGSMSVAPTCSITNHFLAGEYGPVTDYSVIPIIPITDESISGVLSFSRPFRRILSSRPLKDQPSAGARWKTIMLSSPHLTVYSDQLIPDINSFRAFWTSKERQKSGEPLSPSAQLSAKETAQQIISYISNHLTNIPLQDMPNSTGLIHVIYRSTRDSSSLSPTDAYARAIVHRMSEEANQIARRLQLPEDFPIMETNLLATLPLPGTLLAYDPQLTIETRNYSYTFNSHLMIRSIECRYFTESLNEIKTKYLLPVEQTDTNAALAEGLQIMVAAGLNTNALICDCLAETRAALPGGPRGAVFVPCYHINWRLADTNISNRGELVAMLEFFAPTHAVESLEIFQPKYFLNPPPPALDFPSLLTPENSREAVLKEMESIKTNKPERFRSGLLFNSSRTAHTN